MPLIAAAIGMFDGVHLGHQAIVRQVCRIAELKGLVPAVFTFDSHPMLTIAPDRSPRMLTTSAQRLDLLRKAGAKEAYSLQFDEQLRRLTAELFLMLLRDKYGLRALVMGFNHRFGSDKLTDFALYQSIGERIGIDISLAPELKIDGIDAGVSSSAIRQALMRGDADLAATMLGRSYALMGAVEHGARIGSTIGFPTANVRALMPTLLVPARGVYAGAISWKEGSATRRYPAMINIGSRPTVEQDGCDKIEAHAIGYAGDLYGKEVEVEFSRWLREEKKFPDLQSLQSQLLADQREALALNLGPVQ